MKVKKGLMKKKKFNFSVYNNFKLSLHYLKETKKYIWSAVIIFLIFSLIGFFLPIFFEEMILNLINELIEKTTGLDFIGLIGFIFLNNLKSSFFGMFLGVVFGVFPFFALVMNGYVLGFVASKTVDIEGLTILWRLLPHGVFEIPAVMISLGLGLKLGSYFFVKHKKKELWNWVLNSLRVFVFIIIPLLVISAFIEGVLIYLLS